MCAGKGKKKKKKGKGTAAPQEDEDLDALLAEIDGAAPAKAAEPSPEPSAAAQPKNLPQKQPLTQKPMNRVMRMLLVMRPGRRPR